MSDKLWAIESFSHHRQGRGGSHYKVDFTEIGKGSKLTERFNAGSTLEGVEMSDRRFGFLYLDNVTRRIHLMDRETFEERDLPIDAVVGAEKAIDLLSDEMDITVSFVGDSPVIAKLPMTAAFKVAYTDPPASTVTNESKGTSFKNATLENGVSIQVPEFVLSGDSIVIDLAECKYKERLSSKKK